MGQILKEFAPKKWDIKSMLFKSFEAFSLVNLQKKPLISV